MLPATPMFVAPLASLPDLGRPRSEPHLPVRWAHGLKMHLRFAAITPEFELQASRSTAGSRLKRRRSCLSVEVVGDRRWLPYSPFVFEALEKSQDRRVALLVIGMDDFCERERVEDLDQPPVGEATLMHGPREGAKSAKFLRVGTLGTNSPA